MHEDFKNIATAWERQYILKMLYPLSSIQRTYNLFVDILVAGFIADEFITQKFSYNEGQTYRFFATRGILFDLN